MIPWFQFTTFHIGPVPIQVWGSFVALGMLVAILIIAKRGKRLGLPVQQLLDTAFFMILFGLVFSRLFHVLFYEPAFYLTHFADMVKVWHGGLSSFGGLFGAVIGFFWYTRKKKIDRTLWHKAVDLFSFAAVYGWIIGRLGCVFIHDHLGKPCDCFLAIRMPNETSRLDMAILEIIGMLPLVILFFIFRKKTKWNGWFTSVLFVYYGVLRFILDFWRALPGEFPTGDTRVFGLTPAQYFAMVLVAVGLLMLAKQRRVSRKKIGEVA